MKRAVIPDGAHAAAGAPILAPEAIVALRADWAALGFPRPTALAPRHRQTTS